MKRLLQCIEENDVTGVQLALKQDETLVTQDHQIAIKLACLRNLPRIVEVLLPMSGVNPAVGNQFLLDNALKYSHVKVSTMLLNHQSMSIDTEKYERMVHHLRTSSSQLLKNAITEVKRKRVEEGDPGPQRKKRKITPPMSPEKQTEVYLNEKKPPLERGFLDYDPQSQKTSGTLKKNSNAINNWDLTRGEGYWWSQIVEENPEKITFEFNRIPIDLYTAESAFQVYMRKASFDFGGFQREFGERDSFSKYISKGHFDPIAHDTVKWTLLGQVPGDLESELGLYFKWSNFEESENEGGYFQTNLHNKMKSLVGFLDRTNVFSYNFVRVFYVALLMIHNFQIEDKLTPYPQYLMEWMMKFLSRDIGIANSIIINNFSILNKRFNEQRSTGMHGMFFQKPWENSFMNPIFQILYQMCLSKKSRFVEDAKMMFVDNFFKLNPSDYKDFDQIRKKTEKGPLIDHLNETIGKFSNKLPEDFLGAYSLLYREDKMSKLKVILYRLGRMLTKREGKFKYLYTKRGKNIEKWLTKQEEKVLKGFKKIRDIVKGIYSSFDDKSAFGTELVSKIKEWNEEYSIHFEGVHDSLLKRVSKLEESLYETNPLEGRYQKHKKWIRKWIKTHNTFVGPVKELYSLLQEYEERINKNKSLNPERILAEMRTHGSTIPSITAKGFGAICIQYIMKHSQVRSKFEFLTDAILNGDLKHIFTKTKRDVKEELGTQEPGHFIETKFVPDLTFFDEIPQDMPIYRNCLLIAFDKMRKKFKKKLEIPRNQIGDLWDFLEVLSNHTEFQQYHKVIKNLRMFKGDKIYLVHAVVLSTLMFDEKFRSRTDPIQLPPPRFLHELYDLLRKTPQETFVFDAPVHNNITYQGWNEHFETINTTGEFRSEEDKGSMVYFFDNAVRLENAPKIVDAEDINKTAEKLAIKADVAMWYKKWRLQKWEQIQQDSFEDKEEVQEVELRKHLEVDLALKGKIKRSKDAVLVDESWRRLSLQSKKKTLDHHYVSVINTEVDLLWKKLIIEHKVFVLTRINSKSVDVVSFEEWKVVLKKTQRKIEKLSEKEMNHTWNMQDTIDKVYGLRDLIDPQKRQKIVNFEQHLEDLGSDGEEDVEKKWNTINPKVKVQLILKTLDVIIRKQRELIDKKEQEKINEIFLKYKADLGEAVHHMQRSDIFGLLFNLLQTQFKGKAADQSEEVVEKYPREFLKIQSESTGEIDVKRERDFLKEAQRVEEDVFTKYVPEEEED